MQSATGGAVDRFPRLLSINRLITSNPKMSRSGTWGTESGTLPVLLPNPSTLLPWGHKEAIMDPKDRPDSFRPITLWSILAEFDHDQREEQGKTVHSYLGRRCRLELLLRQVMDQLGCPPAKQLNHNL